MGFNQNYKHLHHKGSHKPNEKKTHTKGESICKQWNQQVLTFQNIQTANTTQ